MLKGNVYLIKGYWPLYLKVGECTYNAIGFPPFDRTRDFHSQEDVYCPVNLKLEDVVKMYDNQLMSYSPETKRKMIQEVVEFFLYDKLLND